LNSSGYTRNLSRQLPTVRESQIRISINHNLTIKISDLHVI
jgi:hypothetical protein